MKKILNRKETFSALPLLLLTLPLVYAYLNTWISLKIREVPGTAWIWVHSFAETLYFVLLAFGWITFSNLKKPDGARWFLILVILVSAFYAGSLFAIFFPALYPAFFYVEGSTFCAAGIAGLICCLRLRYSPAA